MEFRVPGSRGRPFTLRALSEEQIIAILRRALSDTERGLGKLHITIDEDALQQLAIFANGDARTALNALELAAQGSERTGEDIQQEQQGRHITLPLAEEVMQHRAQKQHPLRSLQPRPDGRATDAQ